MLDLLGSSEAVTPLASGMENARLCGGERSNARSPCVELDNHACTRGRRPVPAAPKKATKGLRAL